MNSLCWGMTVEVRNSSADIICMVNPLQAKYGCLGHCLAAAFMPSAANEQVLLFSLALLRQNHFRFTPWGELEAKWKFHSSLTETQKWSIRLQRKTPKQSAVSIAEWYGVREKEATPLRLPLYYAEHKRTLHTDKMANICSLDTVFVLSFLEMEPTKVIGLVKWSGGKG